MARFVFATNIQTKHTNGDFTLTPVKRLGSDSNTDDVVISFNATNVVTRTALRAAAAILLQAANGGNELTP